MRGSGISQRTIASGSKRFRRIASLRVPDRLDVLRLFATGLVAVALVLRALVPVGWMPDAAASQPGAMIPCPMMDGMAGMAMPMPSQGKDQTPAGHRLPQSHEGSICPFATTAQPTRVIEPRQIEIVRPYFAFFAPVVSIPFSGWDHVPRAPPPHGNATTT
jgi:hypothetical protein